MATPACEDINTSMIDHIVYLSLPGTVEDTTQKFEELGFRVLPGGVHADGLTANALVVFEDGVYLELICFTHPPAHYPLGSPERAARDSHRWARAAPGWIDYAFLGTGDAGRSVSARINERSLARGNDALYLPEVAGGRVRMDGVQLQWLISAPIDDVGVGALPFFCGDVTPRSLRVPHGTPNTEHPSAAAGVALVRLAVHPSAFSKTAERLTVVVGREPAERRSCKAVWALSCKAVWALEAPASQNLRPPPHLVLEADASAGERARVVEVGIRVRRAPERGDSAALDGTLGWVSL